MTAMNGKGFRDLTPVNPAERIARSRSTATGGNGSGGGRPARPSARFIHRPNTLKAKVGSGGLPAEILEQAEAEVTRHADTMRDDLLQEADRLHALVVAARATLAADCGQSMAMTDADLLHSIRDRAAALKPASSFGYELAGWMASNLAALTGVLQGLTPRDLDIVEAHADAIRAVIVHDIQGRGSVVEDSLCESLRDVVRRRLQDVQADMPCTF